uniref:Glutamate receptor n=1 Tax=Ananas comosus var. bracteatus TaxID=296719 RepID=A0A6V7P414_ANACO|nr:unnamed protein product [Ananas comosus var. bracteatus]
MVLDLIVYCYLLCFFVFAGVGGRFVDAATVVNVGALLDLESVGGKASLASIELAVEDFYAAHGDFASRVVVHARDSKADDVSAASAAIDLLKNVQVQAIVGPPTSAQAAFIAGLGSRTRVPILSFSATSPTVSPARAPFFVRTALNDASQVGAVAAAAALFAWREAVPVYEDSDYGSGVIPSLVDALQSVAGARVPYRSAVPPGATDARIAAELYKLMLMETRVFVVHMAPELASRLFIMARELGMMSEGHAWIVTDGVAAALDALAPNAIAAMQGVVGVRPHVPPSRKLVDFAARFAAKFPAPTVIQLWAYDTVTALAMAAEDAAVLRTPIEYFRTNDNDDAATDIGRLGVSRAGDALLAAILNTSFDGLSGRFRMVGGQLQATAFEVVNVVGKSYRQVGFWRPGQGLSKVLEGSGRSTGELRSVIWPGDTAAAPRGWEIPAAGRRLWIGVPVKHGFGEFVKVGTDPVTGRVSVTGYCIDVFDAVIRALPYAVLYEYVPFDDKHGEGTTCYDDLVYQVYLKNFDAVVGDTTIVANRSQYVDFTLPYTESGVAMVVPMRDKRSKSMWIFLKPLKEDLWIAAIALFVFTGFMIWAIEQEKLLRSLSKFALINWMLVAWLLEKNYNASLTSMMTVEQLQPTVSDVNELLKNGHYVGYQEGSFVINLLKSLHFDERKLKPYRTPDEYIEGLSRGSWNGGVAAIFDEIPYLKLFLSQHCDDYDMVGRIYKTGGFGFVFPRNSPLVADVSQAVLNVTEGDTIMEIERKWFGDQLSCSGQRSSLTSTTLDLQSFRGVFIITIAL